MRTQFGEFEMRAPAVLLVGAPGPLTTALLHRFADAARRDPRRRVPVVLGGPHPADPVGTRRIHGDPDSPRFGLPSRRYAELADQVSAIVQVSGASQTGGGPATADRHQPVVAFAERAGVPRYVLESAYSDATHTPAEQMDGGEVVTIRTSLVLDDDRGSSSRGSRMVHLLCLLLRNGWNPLASRPTDMLLDCLPISFVADAVARIVAAGVECDVVWLTQGNAALTIGQIAEIARGYDAPDRAASGLPSVRPGAGVLLPQMTPLYRKRLLARLDRFALRVFRNSPLESSLGNRFVTAISELGAIGVPALPDPDQVLADIIISGRREYPGAAPKVAVA